PLDVIGNGSFGIIRKVRRKQDGVVNRFRTHDRFERMNECDRKQVVAEVFVYVVCAISGKTYPEES
ncbi:hypothetical protein DFH94DRAFT_639572, partial [Russula ochroleuca]